MVATDEQLLSFLENVYKGTQGKLLEELNMWALGETLGWERKKTRRVYQRLQDKGLLEPYALGGDFVLTVDGLDFCEKEFKAPAERQESRFQVLRALYDATDGVTSNDADIFSVGKPLGLDREDATQILLYLSKSGFIKGTSVGGMTRLTPYGIRFVEEQLGPYEGLSLTREEILSPHQDKREYGFFYVDVIDHSRLLKKYKETGELLNEFKDLVRRKARNNKGDLADNWGGDGGYAYFPGDRCQERAFQAAASIIEALPQFNEESKIAEAIRIRLAVHTDSLSMPEDHSEIHSTGVNFAKHLAETSAIPDNALVSHEVFGELSLEKREQLRLCEVKVPESPVYVYPKERH